MADAELLEQGDLYFLYTPRMRPRPELPFEADERVAGPRDVQRLHVVLSPRGKRAYRRLLVGRKRMPVTRRGSRTNMMLTKWRGALERSRGPHRNRSADAQ